ncbi:hypothetical protein CYMTET_30830, partial [Cymbomonas tetramitiformis]
FGCLVDCGEDQNIYPVIIEIEADFRTSPTSSLSPFDLMSSVTWNICFDIQNPAVASTYDNICWFKQDQTFDTLLVNVIEKLELPEGTWDMGRGPPAGGDMRAVHLVMGRFHLLDMGRVHLPWDAVHLLAGTWGQSTVGGDMGGSTRWRTWGLSPLAGGTWGSPPAGGPCSPPCHDGAVHLLAGHGPLTGVDMGRGSCMDRWGGPPAGEGRGPPAGECPPAGRTAVHLLAGHEASPPAVVDKGSTVGG